jgi:3,4-dihydroxy 2-butanone 4-phosphate synthase / GTP cyclohydrolase II
VLVRVHFECLTADVLRSRRCRCGELKELSLTRLAAEREGVLLYLREEGGVVGLRNKLHAHVHEPDHATEHADPDPNDALAMRKHGIAAQSLLSSD